MKKNFIIGFIWVLVFLAAYIGYKVFLLSEYKADINDKLNMQLAKVGNPVVITTNPNIANGQMIKYKKIIYKTIGNNFAFDEEKISNDGIKGSYVYYYNDEYLDTYNAKFEIGRTYSMNDIIVLHLVDNYDFHFKNIDVKKVLSKYNINNDFDIAKYMVTHRNSKMDVLSSIDQIKLDYIVRTYANVTIPTLNISLIEGNYQGYIYAAADNSFFEVHIIHDNENYVLNFTNGPDTEYFTLDNVKEFISNIHFYEQQ